MMEHSQQSFNAADVADAVFASMLIRGSGQVAAPDVSFDLDTVKTIVETMDHGLKMAGLSFAEYLDRLRCPPGTSIAQTGQRWRFSARERAVQRVDQAVSQLCVVMQQLVRAS